MSSGFWQVRGDKTEHLLWYSIGCNSLPARNIHPPTHRRRVPTIYSPCTRPLPDHRITRPHTALRHLPTGEGPGPFRPSAEYNSGAARPPPAIAPSPLFLPRLDRSSSTFGHDAIDCGVQRKQPGNLLLSSRGIPRRKRHHRTSSLRIAHRYRCTMLCICEHGQGAGSVGGQGPPPSGTVVGGSRRATGTEGQPETEGGGPCAH